MGIFHIYFLYNLNCFFEKAENKKRARGRPIFLQRHTTTNNTASRVTNNNNNTSTESNNKERTKRLRKFSNQAQNRSKNQKRFWDQFFGKVNSKILLKFSKALVSLVSLANQQWHGALQEKEIKALSALVVSCCVLDKKKKISRTCMAMFHACLTVGSVQLFISFCYLKSSMSVDDLIDTLE